MYAVFTNSPEPYTSRLAIYTAKYERLSVLDISHDDCINSVKVLIEKEYPIHSNEPSALFKHTWIKIPNRIILSKSLKNVVDPEILHHLEYNVWLDKVNNFQGI